LTESRPPRAWHALAIGVVGWFAVLGFGVPALAAVADYVGKPIGSVRVTIESRETIDPTLTQVVETAAGQPLSMAAVRESITHLFSTGRFEGVSVEAALENGRVALRYELTPIHAVARMDFVFAAPASGVSDGELRRAVTDRFGATPALGRATDMARVAEAALAERGYLHATVTPEARIDHASERASLVFTVDPKARTSIGDVEIVGRPVLARAELTRRLGLTPGAPYQRDRLTASIERYLADRRSRGFYEARLVPAVQLADDDRVANVTLTIVPGPHVRVVFAGDSLPADRRDELVPVAREGSVDEDLLEDSGHRIEEYFRAQGYRKATASYNRDASENGELVVTFTIDKGPLYRVQSYEITGNASLPLDELTPALKVRVGLPFADSLLDADVSTIEALYRRRGFAGARVQAGVEPPPASAPAAQLPVVVRIVIAEGVRTLVDAATFEGNSAIDSDTLRGKIGLRAGGPYLQGQVAVDRDAIQAIYQDLGYQNVRVDATPRLSADGTTATVAFRIQEGARVFVDHVLIVGNVRTKAETIERELQVKAGDPYNLGAITESQRRLVALGLFRRVRISELRHGNETTRDLLISVEEAPPTTIGYGVGAEGRRIADTRDASGAAAERFDIAPRALFEVGRRNLFGKNRSANLFTSVSRSVVSSLIEYRAVATFREPRLFDTAADAFLNGTFEQQHRSTFDFARRSLSASLERRLSGPYRVTGTYQLQRTRVFHSNISDNDLPLIDRTFPQFRLSSFAGAMILDTRDDALDTHHGEYASASLQVAARAIGSEVGFSKSYLTAQIFRLVPHSRQVVFAGSARMGIASGFSNEGQLPASERFFAGGDTTVRGFAIDQLGIRHTPSQAGDTIDENGFAIGGNGLAIFNAELRLPVTGGIGVVGFVDTGNVFARAADISLGELRTAVGAGLRYKSPVGPLRFDIGAKINRQPGESRTEWFVSFGQAF
jgi:outer membrane protein assembly complex protein YaeT